ncbi:ribonuclease III [Planctomycetota bacterium]
MLSTILGYSFENPHLLEEALTHPSAGQPFDNQRLEFLGDAVVDLVIAQYLFEKCPEFGEGDMTLAKTAVVNGRVLAQRGLSIGLGDMISVGKGLGDREKWPESVYRDAFEALVGAVYLDSDFEKAKHFVLESLSEEIRGAIEQGTAKDYKSLLLEFTQAGSGEKPAYRVIDEGGPAHDKVFVITVTVGALSGRGEGRTKKDAEQRAAEDLLKSASLA